MVLDFGDGINSKHAMNATHTFTRPGIYNVTLTVTNAAGRSSVTKPGYIIVTESASTVRPVADFDSPEAESVLNQPIDHGIYESEAVSFFDNSTSSPPHGCGILEMEIHQHKRILLTYMEKWVEIP